jgi:hypothetical protein
MHAASPNSHRLGRFSPFGALGNQLNRFKEIDRRAVHDPGLSHRVFEARRRGEILGPLRVLGIEDDNEFVRVIGRAKHAWIGEASRLLRSGMSVERGTPFAVVLHLMADDSTCPWFPPFAFRCAALEASQLQRITS